MLILGPPALAQSWPAAFSKQVFAEHLLLLGLLCQGLQLSSDLRSLDPRGSLYFPPSSQTFQIEITYLAGGIGQICGSPESFEYSSYTWGFSVR